MQDSLQGNTRLVEGRTEADELLRRIESVPFSGWHARARVIVGSATFFDALGRTYRAGMRVQF